MTRSTAEIMEWRDPIQVARLEAYVTGYNDAVEDRHTSTPTSVRNDYEAGYASGLRFLAAANASPSRSLTQPR